MTDKELVQRYKMALESITATYLHTGNSALNANKIAKAVLADEKKKEM